MTDLRRWIREQFGRFRAWRSASAQERLRRFLAKANRPENVSRLRRKNEKEFGRLILKEAGFCLLKDGRGESAIRWVDVRTVRTYKRDLFTCDLICLTFQIGENKWIEISERMVDFLIVTETMQTKFPEIPKDWYLTVMLPPFETNDRVLWSRRADGGAAQSHVEAQ